MNWAVDDIHSRPSTPTNSALLAGRRVLMFSLTYPPEEVGTAPYAGGTAEHLVRLGANVLVVTGMPHYPQWRVWDGYRGRWRMSERSGGVDVLRLRSYVPSKQSAVERAFYDMSFLLRGILTTGGAKPDIALAVVPCLADGILARVASRRHGIPLGIIVQDVTAPAAEQSGIPGGRSIARSTRGIERWVFNGASRVAVVSEGFAPYLESLGVCPSRIRRVRNWSRMPPPVRAVADVRLELGWRTDQTVVLHAGNMGYKQALDHVLRAARIAMSSYSQLRFVFMGDGSQRTRLEEEAKGLSNVSFLQPRYGEEFADLLHAADILLVNERSSVVDMSLPSKLTSYFVAGRPVVASVRANGVTAREVERSGGGLVINAEDPSALVTALAALAADPERQQELTLAGARYAAMYLGKDEALHGISMFVSDLMTDGEEEAARQRLGAS